MRVARLEAMTKGWFIGNFTPTLWSTEAVEVAVKRYAAGASESRHFHKIATEFTVVMSGAIEMNGRRFVAGDIVVIEPGEAVDFLATEATVTTVVKIPGAAADKYPG